MRTIYQISILAVLVLCIACSSVNSNPSGGARELCQELLTYAKNNNYEDASKRMEQYYNAYNDKDKKVFLWFYLFFYQIRQNISQFFRS